ncbi:Olfactory receptor 14J1, partial [Opisthocomus hoazin]
QRQQKSNSSSITQFLLLAFSDTWEMQLLHFWLFLVNCLAVLVGKGLIVTTVACNHRLRILLYFFLLKISINVVGSISTTVLKFMASSPWDSRDISYAGYVAQVILFACFVGAEYCLLTVMASDRYVALWKPLRACVHMAVAAWGHVILNSVLHTVNTFSIHLCKGNAVDQFFCEIPHILKLSCSHSYLREVGLLGISGFPFLGCFYFIMLSYVQIFRAVLRIPSAQGRHKTFPTCLPHLVVVSLFISTSIFACLKSPSIYSLTLDLVMAVVYLVVTPALNPLIYSRRNKELQAALRKLMT